MTLSSFSQLPAIPKPAPAPVVTKATAAKLMVKSVRGLFSSRRELVAGGDIKWKPVDRLAARMLIKSREEFHPPPSKPNMKNCTDSGIRSVADAPSSNNDISASVCASLPERAARKERQLLDLANNAAEAKALMEEIMSTMNAEVMAFSDSLPNAVKTLRSWRMAIVQERDLSLSALNDLRKFFLGADHDKEMARLENFIRTCERLRSIAQDGTLAKVSDVMLKLI